jgi:NAD(P)-dependent dehydrogenase (short-subunit alcohol dehydrogenase family)
MTATEHTVQSSGLQRNVMELLSLKGKVALVTGGAGRYGSQISRALAEAGATVIVASRDRARCDAFAAS